MTNRTFDKFIDISIWFSLSFIFGMLLATGCGHAPPAPDGSLPADGLARVYRVTDRVYRSPQPSTAQLVYLHDHYGIQTVVKLNEPWEGHDADLSSIKTLKRPMNPLGLGDDVDGWLEQTVDDLDEAPGPILVHCTHGEDRTGVVVAAYRIKHGSAYFAARAEMLAYGSRDFEGFRHALERWAAVYSPF